MGDKDFYVGKKFKDFNELAAAIKSLEKQTFCQLKKIDGRTVNCANKLKPVKGPFYLEKFKYSYVKYACKHYGSYRSRGKGHRPRQKTHKIGCPMFIHINTNRYKAEMVVTAVKHEHNHPLGPEKQHINKKQQPNIPNNKVRCNKRKNDNSSEDDFLPPAKFHITTPTRKKRLPLLSKEQKYNQALNVVKQIASLASELDPKEFKETIAMLKKLKTCMMLREEIQLSFDQETYEDLETLYNSAENDEVKSTSEPSCSEDSSGDQDSNLSDYSDTPPSPTTLQSVEENSLVDFDITNKQTNSLNSSPCQNKLHHRGKTFRNDLSFYSNSTEFEERTKLAKHIRVPKQNISRVVCNITITNLNLYTLEQDGWIDDQIINAYLQLLAKDYTDIYVLPSFVMTVMAKSNGQQSSFFYPKVSFDRKRVILIPVHSDDHWFLLVAEMSSCSLMVLDSFPSHSRAVKFFNLWRKYFTERSQFLGLTHYEWNLSLNLESSRQLDTCSCGVFLLMNAEAVMKDCNPRSYGQQDVSKYREWVLYSLLKNSRTNSNMICDLPFCNNKGATHWVQCDKCNRWAHMSCVKLKAGSQVKSFKCPLCI